MFTPEEQPRDGGDLFEEVTVANVADLRAMRRNSALTITLRHADLPAGISFGTFYLATPPRLLFKALEAYLPQFLSDLEAGVPDERSPALSSLDILRAIFGEGVVVSDVVPDSEERR